MKNTLGIVLILLITLLYAQDESVNGDLTIGISGDAGNLKIRRGSDGNIAGLVGFLGGGAENNNLSLQSTSGGGFISFRTNSGGVAERMRIANNGNIGIGSTNPISPLHVQGASFPQTRINNLSGGEAGIRLRSYTASDKDLHVDLVAEYSGTADEQGKFHIRVPWNSPERLTIDHTGNTGIGTTAPSSKLEVYNAAASSHLILSANDNPSADGTRVDLDFKVANRDHIVGRLASFYTSSSNGGSGGLRFYTRSTGTLSERLRINPSGYVGIGYTNPLSQLIVGSSFGASVSGSSGGNAVFGTNLAIQQGGTNHNKLYTPYSHSNNYGYAGLHARWGDLRFYTSDGNTTQGLVVNPITRMLIDPDGNIGVGTTTPSSRLEVHNTAAASHLVLSADDQSAADATRIDIDFEVANRDHIVGRVASFYSTSANGGSGGLRFYTRSAGTLDERLRIASNGNVGIGTTSPDTELTVKGTIHTEEVKVDLSVPGPDYVFEPDYELRTLEETKEYIEENKHLPEIPSAKEMETNGVDLGDMNMRLLKKIEELTLHQIDLLEKMKAQQELLNQQQKRIAALEKKN